MLKRISDKYYGDLAENQWCGRNVSSSKNGGLAFEFSSKYSRNKAIAHYVKTSLFMLNIQGNIKMSIQKNRNYVYGNKQKSHYNIVTKFSYLLKITEYSTAVRYFRNNLSEDIKLFFEQLQNFIHLKFLCYYFKINHEKYFFNTNIYFAMLNASFYVSSKGRKKKNC